MVSAYTPRNRLNKQGTGDNTNTWGLVLNDGAIELIDAALDGWATVPVSAPVTLTSVNGAADQSRSRTQKLTGAGGTVTLPAVEKWFWVWNAGSGNMVLTVGGVTTATIEPNDKLLVLTDGLGVYSLSIAGLALKQYIDTAILATTGSLPATTGNEGKVLVVRSLAWTPSQVATSELSDIATYTAARRAEAIAFAVAL